MKTREVLDRAAAVLQRQTRPLEPAVLSAFVQRFLDRRDAFLDLTARCGSPLYVLEPQTLRERAGQFAAAFAGELPESRIYYAVKCNHHGTVLRTLVEAGLGLDVSSGVELELALECGAKDIVFSGPGKTEAELRLAVEQRAGTTVLLDSFSELQRLERVAAAASAPVRAGVRLMADERGGWRKFGIPLAALGDLLQAAEACAHVDVRGLQFHRSWNRDAARQVNFIAQLGRTLARLPQVQRSRLEFVDVGGGFWPPQGEWLQRAATPAGGLRQAAMPDEVLEVGSFCLPAATIEQFAQRIGEACRRHLFPHVACAVYFEPGRWLCHDAMHLLLTVIDKKADDLVITDAGTNAVGWERFEHDYFPVINLTRPSLTERPCHVMGALCTPHDFWGYTCHGDGVEEGDVLLIPTQGAYTYSLRQTFIKALPAVVVLEDSAAADPERSRPQAGPSLSIKVR